jgi:hypothetical protein
VCDKRVKGRKRNAFVPMEIDVGAAWEAIARSHRKSVRRLAHFGVSNYSAWKICRDDSGCLEFHMDLQ